MSLGTQAVPLHPYHQTHSVRPNFQAVSATVTNRLRKVRESKYCFQSSQSMIFSTSGAAPLTCFIGRRDGHEKYLRETKIKSPARLSPKPHHMFAGESAFMQDASMKFHITHVICIERVPDNRFTLTPCPEKNVALIKEPTSELFFVIQPIWNEC